MPLARAPLAANLVGDRRSAQDGGGHDGGSSSASSLRDQRLAQRWAERAERRPMSRDGQPTPSAVSWSPPPTASSTSAQGPPPYGRGAPAVPPPPANESRSTPQTSISSYLQTALPGVELSDLPDGYTSWTPEQLHAYVLAQQLAMMQRGTGRAWPALATPQLPPGSALGSRPSSAATGRGDRASDVGGLLGGNAVHVRERQPKKPHSHLFGDAHGRFGNGCRPATPSDVGSRAPDIWPPRRPGDHPGDHPALPPAHAPAAVGAVASPPAQPEQSGGGRGAPPLVAAARVDKLAAAQARQPAGQPLPPRTAQEAFLFGAEPSSAPPSRGGAPPAGRAAMRGGRPQSELRYNIISGLYE